MFMAIVRNTQANNGNVSGGSARVSGSGGFVNLREIIGKADDEINGGGYAWQERARPQNDQAREYLESFKDDSKERRTGRDTWDGESKQKMSDFDRIAAGLSRWGDSMQVEAGGDLSKNIINSTIGTVFSPVAAFGSFVGNAYESVTGKPVTEGDEEGYMPDYELDSNERAAAGANAAIDLAGLSFGGSKDMIQAGARGLRYGMAKAAGEKGKDIAAGIAKEAVEATPHGAWDFAKRIGSNMLEEGGEEAAQSVISDIRYDQFGDGTAERAIESFGWGALGGASMTGIAMAANGIMGRGAKGADASGDTGSTHVSGRPSYESFTTPESVVGKADTDIQEVYEKRQDQDKYVPGSTNYKVVQGRYDIKPAETIVGTRGLKKMYGLNDESRKYVADSLGIKQEDADRIFTLDDASMAKELNALIADNRTVEVYLKREPHTRDTSYMKFRLKEVMPGNAVMTNTMTPQLNGGDIDGDTMGFLWNKDIAGRANYPTASLMSKRPLPGKDGLPGRYGQVNLSADYTGFSLDSALRTDSEWKLPNGVDPITQSFRETFGDMRYGQRMEGEDNRPLMSDVLMSRITKAWGDGDGQGKDDRFSETVLQLMNARDTVARQLIGEGMDATKAYDAVDAQYMSDLIWNLQQYTGGYVQIKKMMEAGEGKALSAIVNAAPIDTESVQNIAGTQGRWSRVATMFSKIGTIDQMFEMTGNIGLRFKQNMYWSSTSSRNVDEALEGMPPVERFQQLINNVMRIVSYDATPQRQVENLFRAYVSRDVRRALGMTDARFDSPDIDIDRLREVFEERYNHYSAIYNKAAKQTGIDTEFASINTKSKGEIKGSRSFSRAFMDVFGSYAADDQGHTLEQIVAMAVDGNTSGQFIDVFIQSGKKVNDFFRDLVSDYGGRDYSKGRNFEHMVENVVMDFEVTFDKDGNAVYDNDQLPYMIPYWEMMKNLIGVEVCADYGIANLKTALGSRYARALFGRDFDAKMNAILALRTMYKYREYARNMAKSIEAGNRAEEAEDIADKKNAEADAEKFRKKAIEYAKENYGVSPLDNEIVSEIVTDGSDNYLMNVVSDHLTYAEKTEWFQMRQARRGIGSNVSLIENAWRTPSAQINGSEISNAIAEANKHFTKCEKRLRESAIAETNAVIGLVKTKGYNGDLVAGAIIEQCKRSSQVINVDLMSTVLFDAADVIKNHVDKGSSTPTEAELYQMLAKIYDTGAKSAINRITGSSMASGTMMETASCKSLILRALSDGDFSMTVNADDGSGSFELSREMLFRASGIKLNGRVPSFADWSIFLQSNPSIVSWMCDTTFSPVPDSDTIKETSTGSLSKTLENIITGADPNYQADIERNEIRNIIVNNPRNARVIIGIISANNPGTAFDDLLESPSRWSEEYRNALNSLIDYERYLIASSATTNDIAGRLRYDAFNVIDSQIDSIMNQVDIAVEAMQKNGERVHDVINKNILNDIMASQFASDVLVYLDNAGADVSGVKKSESQNTTIAAKNIAASMRNTAINSVNLTNIIMTLKGKGIATAELFNPIESDIYVDLRNQLVAMGIKTDLIDKAEADSLSKPVTNKLPDFADGKIIMPDDMRPENLGRMAVKIAKIKHSGKYRVYGSDDVGKIYRDLMKEVAANRMDEIERIGNRFNGLILSRALDEYGGVARPEYNTGFYSATLEASNQIASITADLRSAIADGRLKVSSAPERVQAPSIDFRNKTAGVLSDFAISSLESAGNALMSGIEGGEYQQLISLTGLTDGVDFQIKPQLISVDELRERLENGDMALTGCRYIKQTFGRSSVIGKNGAPANIPVQSLEEGNNLTLATLNARGDRFVSGVTIDSKGNEEQAFMYVYPLDDCPIPDVKHMVSATVGGNKRYSPLTNMLINMVADRSEPGTFKRKKDIGKFDEIVRRIGTDAVLGSGRIMRPKAADIELFRTELIKEIKDYRKKLYGKYYEGFIAEQMDKVFGKYDALMLAQLTTPAIRITYADDTTRTIAMTKVFSPEKFAAEKALGDPIVSIKVVRVPLSTVCSKIGRYLTGRFSDYYTTGENMPKQSEIVKATMDALDNFDNFKDLGVQGAKEFLSLISPLSKTSRSRIAVGRSPLPPARFMSLADGDERGIARFGDTGAAVGAKHVDKEWKKAIDDLNDYGGITMPIEYYDLKIAFTDIDKDWFDSRRMKNIDNLRGLLTNPNLTQRISSVSVDGKRPAALILKDNPMDCAAIIREYQEISRNGGTAPVVFIVPKSMESSGVIDSQAFTDTEFDVGGITMTIVDTDRIAQIYSYDGPTPSVFPIVDNDIDIMIGLANISDSPLLLNPNDTDRRVGVSTIASLPSDVLFPGRAFENSVIEMPNGESDLEAFRSAFENREDDNPVFVYPKFPEGNTELSKFEIDVAVRDYLAKADNAARSNLSPCFIDSDVQLGSCIGFVKTFDPRANSVGGSYVYSPVIINKGGVPATISQIYCGIDPSNADQLQFYISGDLTPTEMDAIKHIFSNEAMKGMARMASRDEWDRIGFELGSDMGTGSDRFHINGYYARNTEDGRLTDRGLQSLSETLFYALKARKRGGLFWSLGQDGIPFIDYDAAMDELGISDKRIIDALLNVHKYEPVWDDVINGVLNFKDPDVDKAIKQVALAVSHINRTRYRSGSMTISPASILCCYSMENDGPKTYMLGTESTDFFFSGIQEPDALLKMFHYLDPTICPDGYNDEQDLPYLINKDGEIRIVDKNGKPYYSRGHFMMSRMKHDSSQLGIASRQVAYGNQQVINSILERSFSSARDIKKMIQLVSIGNGCYTPYLINGRYYKPKPPEVDPFMSTNIDRAIEERSKIDYNYDEKIVRDGQRTFDRYLNICESRYDRDTILTPDDPRLKSAYAKFNKAFRFKNEVDPLLAHAVFKMATGYSFNDGDGSNTVTVDQFTTVIDQIAYALENDDGYFIKGGIHNNRYTLPLGPAPIMRFIWDNSDTIQSMADIKGLTYEQWIESAAKEMDVSNEAIGSINIAKRGAKARKKALNRIMEYCYRTHGLGYRGPHIANGFGVNDFIASIDPMYANLEKMDTDLSGMRARQEAQFREQISQWKMHRDSGKFDKIDYPMAPNGFAASWGGLHNSWWDYTAKNLEAMSRTMSMVASPMLPISAFISSAKGLGIANATLHFRSRGDYVIKNQSGLAAACRDPEARQVWDALSELSVNSPQLDALTELGAGNLLDYMKEYRKRQGRIGKISRTVSKIATADGALSSWKIKLYINEFAQNLEPDSPWLAEVQDGSGMTVLEAAVLNDPAKFLMDTLTFRNQTSEFITAQRARDVAMSGDFAQRTSYGLVLQELFKKHPIGEFLVTTGFLKFPNYAINSTGFFMQHIAPVSMLYHWTTSMLVKKAKSDNPFFLGVDLRSMDLESTLRYKEFKEAFHADVINLGMSAVAAILLNILNFEPPEDEEGKPDKQYMGNLNEWTIMGMRIGDAWWLQDIAGPAFALAAFTKSCAIGEPRLDIIGNWMSQAMWNNPVLRASDVAGMVFNMDGDFVDDMLEEADLYEDSKGGAPSLMQMWESGFLTYGMNYVSQFFTPSIIKELYRVMPQYESSYKRVYVTDENGNVVTDENGQPYTVVTDYADQQKRGIARSNPFAALLFNLTAQGETGYSTFSWMNNLFGLHDMPYTVYYQQDELACVQYYSLYTVDENGNEVAKTPAEINAIAYDVLTVLEQAEDMTELRATGWVLPYDTREYVSKLIWDQVHYTNTLWSKWVEEEAYDFTVLGGGDFGTGRQIYEEAKRAKDDDIQHLYDLYDKLWDEALTSGITQYNRYNTTYQQDSYGNWYATGQRKGLLTNAAPGSRQDPGPTMGVRGSWETPAYANPEVSAGGRALVPIDTVYTDVPAISSWSENGDGESYSDMSALTLGALVGNELSPNPSSGRPSYGLTYGRSYGYRRGGGGGGGGGYSPNLYSRLPNVNMPYASNMYSERIYSPNYDYLRPNFETKGSREAYKRSDI